MSTAERNCPQLNAVNRAVLKTWRQLGILELFYHGRMNKTLLRTLPGQCLPSRSTVLGSGKSESRL